MADSSSMPPQAGEVWKTFHFMSTRKGVTHRVTRPISRNDLGCGRCHQGIRQNRQLLLLREECIDGPQGPYALELQKLLDLVVLGILAKQRVQGVKAQ